MLSRDDGEVELRQQLERDAFLPIESIGEMLIQCADWGVMCSPQLLLFLNLTQMLLKEMQFKLSENNLNVETRKIKTTEK